MAVAYLGLTNPFYGIKESPLNGRAANQEAGVSEFPWFALQGRS